MGIRCSSRGDTNRGKKEVNIVVVYNNGKIKEMMRKLRKVLERVEENRKQTLVIGDMNARIGDWQIDEEGEAKRGRQSMDKSVNYEGKKLIVLGGDGREDSKYCGQRGLGRDVHIQG